MGRRVTVRRVVARDDAGDANDGDADPVRPGVAERARTGDVVGDLVHLDAARAVIETRSGPVEVPTALIERARPALASTADELELQHLIALGWRAEQTGQVGGWLLRASGGFTGRGNSVLPLRAAGMPLEDALAAARAWYAERGLPLRLQVPVEARRLLDAELGERGWWPSADVHVRTARLDILLATAPRADTPVELAAAPDEAWLGRFRGGQGTLPAARDLLTRHDRVAFASIRADGQVVAIGRGSLDDGWLGITAVEVEPRLRRQGLAGAVTRALWAWAARTGATRTHLEVSSDNHAAVALYRKLGYHQHHDYRFRSDPEAAAPSLSGEVERPRFSC